MYAYMDGVDVCNFSEVKGLGTNLFKKEALKTLVKD